MILVFKVIKIVSIDHAKNIQRIVDKIKNDPNLFDNGKTAGLLREVRFGDPDNNIKNSIKQKPAAYVTTRDSIQTTRYAFGTGEPNNQNQVTVEYEIVLLAVAKTKTEKSQRQLYSLMTKLENLLDNDPTFKNPETDDDPIFTRSIVNQIPWDSQSKGQLITSVTYVLSATIGNEFSIDFPSIGNVILLSKPDAPEGIVFSDDKIQSKNNRVITENGDFGAIFAEYESTPALDDAFRAKFGVKETITINTGSSSRNVLVVYIEINPTAQFDEIERTILHMEVVKI